METVAVSSSTKLPLIQVLGIGPDYSEGSRSMARGTHITRIAPKKSDIATTSIPAATEPVDFTALPMTDEETKPARLPMELTMAIPPAAAVPRRNLVDSAQNGPRHPQMPIPARHNEASTNGVHWQRVRITMPVAAIRAVPLTCQRRSLR